mgnify:CR=1 FL=1
MSKQPQKPDPAKEKKPDPAKEKKPTNLPNANIGDKVGKNVKVVTSFIEIVHSLIKFLPLGLYFFAYLSAALFKDIRSALLLIGLIFNDIIGYLYKKYNKGTNNPNCNIFTSGPPVQTSSTSENNYYGEFLQNPHTEIISFVSSFFYSDMFYKQKLDVIPFTFLIILLLLTIWSRMALKCKTKFSEVILNIIFGALRGIVFYYFIRKYYVEAEKGVLEKETCDLGFNNYRCDEIKNGTVIIKESNSKQNQGDGNDEEDEDEDF